MFSSERQEGPYLSDQLHANVGIQPPPQMFHRAEVQDDGIHVPGTVRPNDIYTMVTRKLLRDQRDLFEPILISADGIGQRPVADDSRDRCVQLLVHALAALLEMVDRGVDTHAD